MIDIKYDQSKKMLNISVSGTSGIEEFTSALETITNSRDYPPDIRAIWDVRQADLSFANLQLVRGAVNIRSSFQKRDNCRAAIIVSGSLQYGLGRMFQILADGKVNINLQIFRDYEEGKQWLLEDNLTCLSVNKEFSTDSMT